METNEQTMPTKYDPALVEKDRYDFWLKANFLKRAVTRQKSHMLLSFRRQT